MWLHYLDLAQRSSRRDPYISCLVVLLIGLGVAATMTLAAQLQVISGDPMPGRSRHLFYPMMDPVTTADAPRVEPPDQLTWTDALNLLEYGKGTRSVAMTGGRVSVSAGQAGLGAFFSSARYTSWGFGSMFGLPLAAGRFWSKEDDTNRARVVVISLKLAERLWGAPSQAIGKTVQVSKTPFVVVGVMDHWNPMPHFYDIGQGAYSETEDVFLPLATARDLKLTTYGSVECWGDEKVTNLETAPCTWMQLWVQLDNATQVADYRQFLDRYSAEQKQLGRFTHPSHTRLLNVRQWLSYKHVVPSSAKLQLLLAGGFLLTCILNAIALIFVKFLRKRPELATRRAFGARKGAIFLQLLTEACLLGCVASAVAWSLLPIGIWIIHQQPSDYAQLIEPDFAVLAETLALSLLAVLLAAAIPAWLTCRVPPSAAMRAQ